MLVFQFRREGVGEQAVLRPRLGVLMSQEGFSVEASALLDSGADHSILPAFVANLLKLKRGRSVRTYGIGDATEGYESSVDITFVDANQQHETVTEVPIYVIPGITAVVIGRKKIFDMFRITFEQFQSRILLERT